MPYGSERHAQHDPLLVASLAAGDLADADRDRAAALLGDCVECRVLHDDLVSIARATAALPAAVRPRDFRIGPEQAARLRPGGWRRFVAAFGSPRLAMTRQLGVGLATLGLAGLLISALPSFPLGMAGSAAASAAPEQDSIDSRDQAAPLVAPSAAPAADPSAAAADASAAPSASGTSATPYGGEAAVVPAASEPGRVSASDDVTAQNETLGGNDGTPGDGGGAVARDVGSADGGGGPLLPIASAILLAAGIALLVGRRLARRITAG
jgi:hypothetical protein